VLHDILATAVSDDALMRNPCRIAGAGQAPSEERPLLDLEQVRRLAANTPGHRRGLVELAFWGHLRLGELLALRIGDVSVDKGTVTVHRQVVETDSGPVVGPPKSGSQRTVHLPPQGVDALSEHLRLRGPALPAARLFVRRDGSTLRAHHVHAAWNAARKAAELPDAHLHDLRHAGLALAAQSGATLAEVMRRAGHSSSRAAMIYQHAAERRDAEVAERLGRLAAGTWPNGTGT
jgi:integrase